MRDLTTKINILIIHRENLATAKTFEEYQKAHVAYVDMLIGELMGQKQSADAVLKYAAETNKENN